MTKSNPIQPSIVSIRVILFRLISAVILQFSRVRVSHLDLIKTSNLSILYAFVIGLVCKVICL
ncbi:hypothetical protein NC653_025637 [Populus alba x Populus x berolinensis]|uniref:Uncharacterized protein n=1 Tax=Populus alba x Populus x berolinensis TaxID=444605 RepID=A0AAD6MBT0_9ROSI|nr:hypothetical protein NC653_025637 [Populus alba x Populus x berolinensis]